MSQNPFDYQYAENYALQEDDDPLINNSYYFSAHDGEMSVFARLGKRVNADESWFAVYVDGKMYSLREELFPSGKSPVVVGKDKDGWTLSFKGRLNDGDEADFHATFVPLQPPLDFTSNMPAERMAVGIANEKWNKTFFEQLQLVSGQCHYEQEGLLEGQMTLNGKTYSLHLPCVRDHSFGKRDWNYMNNHWWLMAVSPVRQFNYSLVSYPVLSVLEVGHYRDETGMRYMMKADLDFRQVSQGSIPSELSFRMKLNDESDIAVGVKVLAGRTYHFQNGQYILHENIAEFTLDGESCRGILEIGFNRDGNRYFTQKETKRKQK
jgi:hypothetical protein